MKDSIAEHEVGRELFDLFVAASIGRPIEDVLSASANMIANCLRQNYGKRSEVESRMKELFGKTMDILLEHYDTTTGVRRSIVRFDQSVRPQMILWDDVFENLGDRRKDH